MPEKLILQDGTEMEVPTAEELEQQDKEKEELRQKLNETTVELSKLQNKDYNFKKLRDMTEAEREKLTETEQALKQKQEELEEGQKQFATTLIDSFKNEALAVLVGDDKTLKERVMKNYDRIVGSAVSKEEVNQRMREAFNMLGIKQPVINPINQAFGASSGAGIAKTTGKLSPEQVDLASKLGLSDDDLKKVK